MSVFKENTYVEFLPYKHGCPANTEIEEAADNLQKYRRPLLEARLTDERRAKGHGLSASPFLAQNL